MFNILPKPMYRVHFESLKMPPQRVNAISVNKAANPSEADKNSVAPERPCRENILEDGMQPLV